MAKLMWKQIKLITIQYLYCVGVYLTSRMTDYSHRQSSQPQLGLLQQLAKIWENLKVPQEYRMITMKYLTSLPNNQQQKYLMYEIEWNSSHQSHYQLIFRLNMRRNITIFRIKSLLKELKPFQNAKIEQLCLLLCNLRELNVQTSEKVIEMIRFYNLVLEEIQERKILSFLWQLINNLQEDNQPILASQFRHLLKIDGNFDPYFISYYENQSKRSNESLAKNVQKLYSLSIKEVYKVISLKHKIQLIMTTIDYRLKSQENTSKHSYYLKRAKNISSPSQLLSNQAQRIYNTGRKYQLPSRSHSHDLANKAHSQDKPEIIQSRSKSNDKLGKSSMHLGKIVRNNKKPPNQSSALKGNLIDRAQKISYTKKGQSLSDRKSGRLNHIQLQPINIKIEKLQKISSPQNVSLPLKQAYQQRQDNTQQSQFVEYSHIKITKINNLSRKNVQSFKHPQKKSKKKYDFDESKVKGSRVPGFIKNSKANIFQMKDSEMGFCEENPISNIGIKTAKTETATQQSNKQKRLDANNAGQPSQQSSIIQTVSREIQTERKSTTKHRQIKVKVDIDCQTQLEDNKMYDQANDESQDGSESQKQECNNRQQHQQAISDFKNEEKKLSDSLVTLEEQYFVDERSTPIKRYKIPMIRTITEEESGIIENQKKSVANYISNKQKNKQPERQYAVQKAKDNIQEPSSSKTLKIKIGKCTFQEALIALQTSKIDPKYAEIFQISGKLKQHIKNCQTYILEYLINDQIAVIALASPIPRNTIVIKLWGPMQNIDQSTSETLFLKYVEYLLKNVDKIVYKGVSFGELTKTGFVNKRSDIFEKINEKPIENSTEYEEFFAVKCSNIYVQEECEVTFEQEDGDSFDDNSYYCSQFIRKANLAHLSQQMANLFIEEKNVSSFQEVNKILKEQQYQHSYKPKMHENRKESISLLLLQFNSPMKTNFIVQNGQFLIDVIVHMQEKGKLIVSLPLTKNNSYAYFGKGMSIAEYTSIIQDEPKKIGNGKCRIKMFSRVLQGTLTNNHQFGHWQISFVFEDQIKSASIKHSLNTEKQFGSQPFMVALEIEKQILYCVTINKEDLLY